MEVEVKDAAAQMDELLARVQAGEEIVLVDGDKRVAKLVPFTREPRRPGSLKGQIWMADDMDAVDAEIEALFYAEDDEDDPLTHPAQ